MNSEDMSQRIVARLEAHFGEIQPRGREDLEKMAKALSEAIVGHIADNAKAVISVADSKLQRDTSGGETLAPLAKRTLSIE